MALRAYRTCEEMTQEELALKLGFSKMLALQDMVDHCGLNDKVSVA